jgi:hypothetical protein
VRNKWIRWSLVLAMAATLPGYASAQAAAQTPPPTALDPLKGLAVSRDKMRGLTWYQHPTSPKHVNSNGFYLYFAKDDSGHFAPLRLVVRYNASDWLFVHKAWAKADGVTVVIPQSAGRSMGWERDHRGGEIWEWSDVPLMLPAEISAVRQLASAKSVTVRFEGRQYYADKELSAQQLKALREVIAAYERATGQPWK